MLGSTGLERPAVVLAVNGFTEPDMTRSLLYVGMSRARDLLVVCGPTEAPGSRIFSTKSGARPSTAPTGRCPKPARLRCGSSSTDRTQTRMKRRHQFRTTAGSSASVHGARGAGRSPLRPRTGRCRRRTASWPTGECAADAEHIPGRTPTRDCRSTFARSITELPCRAQASHSSVANDQRDQGCLRGLAGHHHHRCRQRIGRAASAWTVSPGRMTDGSRWHNDRQLQLRATARLCAASVPSSARAAGFS
ncbi:MAG: ATP-binding domain-containing protein [Pseudonocardiaceae bacterium]